ncbi:hypothetical protein AURDEDRAFT_169705 [Auricularia subglabra TFB-10046 SS5]|nr:hypothetical protein AURDEDRAFT_169705 [Auricularia subglabra TFB-10046 SS5]
MAKKTAAKQRAQAKRAAERAAAAEPVSAMSAAEADAQARLLAQCQPPCSPSAPVPSRSVVPSSHAAAPSPSAGALVMTERAKADLDIVRRLAEERRQAMLRPPTPPLPVCMEQASQFSPSDFSPSSHRRVWFSVNACVQPFAKDDPPAAIRPAAHHAASAPPSRPLSAAASLAPCPARPPPPHSMPVGTVLPSEVQQPRELLSLVSGFTGRPWRGLRQRQRRRAPHPHRHQRQRRADARLFSERHLLDRTAQLCAVEDELYGAVYAALGPMYPLASKSRASGWVTPEAPMQPDPGQVEYEIALCVFHGEVQMGFHQPDAVATQNDINRIRAGIWAWRPDEHSGLIATHSFLVRDRCRWHNGLDTFAINYLIGMHNRFCNG